MLGIVDTPKALVSLRVKSCKPSKYRTYLARVGRDAYRDLKIMAIEPVNRNFTGPFLRTPWLDISSWFQLLLY